MSKRIQGVKVNDPECFQKLPPNVLLSLVGNAESFDGTGINFTVASGTGGSVFEVVEANTISGVVEDVDTSGATGDGTLTDVVCNTLAVTEVWTVVCTDATTEGSEVWSVTGAVSGLQTAEATTGAVYQSDAAEISFIITAGDVGFAELDEITIEVVKPTSYIKALVDCRLILEGMAIRSNTDNPGAVQLCVGGEDEFYGQDGFTFVAGTTVPSTSPYTNISSVIQLREGEGISFIILPTDVSTELLNVQVSSVFPE